MPNGDTSDADEVSDQSIDADRGAESDFARLSEQEKREFLMWQVAQKRASQSPDVAEGAPVSNRDIVGGGEPSRTRLQKRWWLPAILGVTAISVAGLALYWRSESHIPGFESVALKCENTMTLIQSSELTGADKFLEVGFDEMDQKTRTAFESAVKYTTVADDGSSLTIDSRDFLYLDPSKAYDLDRQSDRDTYLAKAAAWNLIRDLNTAAVITCVSDQLKLPDALQSRMNQTRALDGTQEAEYGGVVVEWSYHPDVGLNVIYEQR